MKRRFLIALFFLIAAAVIAAISISEFAVSRTVGKFILERARNRLSLIAWGFSAVNEDVDIYALVDFDEEVLTVMKGKLLVFQYGTARLDQGAPGTRVVVRRSGSYEFCLYIDFQAATAKYLGLVRTAIVISTVIFAVLFGVFGWILLSMAVDPIARLASSITDITSRSLQTRVPVPARKDETRQLILTFNAMLDEIQGTYERQARFFEDVTHDIVTPVQILDGYRQLIERHGKMERLVDEYLDVSKVELGRLKDMTGALKAMSAAEKRRNIGPVDVSAATDRIVKYYRELFPELRFESFVDPGVVLKVDAADLERMENILIDNAVKYGSDGGVVEIGLSSAGFSVRDRGRGIAPEEQEAVFERHRRGASAAGKGEGAGIGLAILRRFAEEYDFRVELESRVGEGSVFRLVFPSSEVSP